jgi:hypothetical protein
MTEYTRKEVRRLKPEIGKLLRDAAKTRNASAFIAWLQKHANRLSLERQAKIVAEFKQIVNDESGGGRKR